MDTYMGRHVLICILKSTLHLCTPSTSLPKPCLQPSSFLPRCKLCPCIHCVSASPTAQLPLRRPGMCRLNLECTYACVCGLPSGMHTCNSNDVQHDLQLTYKCQSSHTCAGLAKLCSFLCVTMHCYALCYQGLHNVDEQSQTSDQFLGVAGSAT